jgi:hypothetical protein
MVDGLEHQPYPEEKLLRVYTTLVVEAVVGVVNLPLVVTGGQAVQAALA